MRVMKCFKKLELKENCYINTIIAIFNVKSNFTPLGHCSIDAY